jgi:hypothetical protein
MLFVSYVRLCIAFIYIRYHRKCSAYITYYRLILVPKVRLPCILLYVGKVRRCITYDVTSEVYYVIYERTLNLCKSVTGNARTTPSMKPARIAYETNSPDCVRRDVYNLIPYYISVFVS